MHVPYFSIIFLLQKNFSSCYRLEYQRYYLQLTFMEQRKELCYEWAYACKNSQYYDNRVHSAPEQLWQRAEVLGLRLDFHSNFLVFVSVLKALNGLEVSLQTQGCSPRRSSASVNFVWCFWPWNLIVVCQGLNYSSSKVRYHQGRAERQIWTGNKTLSTAASRLLQTTTTPYTKTADPSVLPGCDWHQTEAIRKDAARN